jgi:hypothetical protein
LGDFMVINLRDKICQCVFVRFRAPLKAWLTRDVRYL